MKDTPNKKNFANNLRELAENKISNDPTRIELTLTDVDVLKLTHELEVQNVELEMQNEELMNTNLAAQRAIDLYDLAPTGYFTLSRDGRILQLNLKGANLLHTDRTTLTGSQFEHFITDETRPAFTVFMQEVFMQKDTHWCEITLSTPENTPLHIYLTGKKDLQDACCLVTATDITERKLNEEILRQEREIFLDILNNQPAGIYRIRVFRPDKWWKDAWSSSENPPYKMELASERFCEIIGKTRGEFEDNPGIIIDLIHPEDKAEFVSKNETANNTVTTFNWEGRLVIGEKIIWVHLESIPRPILNDEVLWTGILYDITDQKQKENALKESENKYRELVDNSPDAIGIYSEGRLVFVNNECLNLMGAASEEELLGKQVLEFAHPDYRELALDRMMNLFTEGKVQPLIEQKFFRLDGSIIDVEVKSMPILFQNKPSVQLIVRDITERKRAEWSLIQSEDRFQQLFNKAPLGYQSLDNDGNFIEVNQQWLDMLGYSREEVIGQKFEDFVSIEYQSGLQYCFSFIENQCKIYKELEMVHKNGTKLFVAIDGRVGSDLQGNFKQTHCILQDITLRRIAENELKKSREDFEDLFEFAPVGYHEIDAEGRIVRINKTELNMLGYSFEELTGQFVWKISADEELSFKAAKEKLEGKNIPLKSFNREFRRKDGSTFPVLIQDKAIRNKEGNVTGIRSTIQDITERIKAENELTRSREDFKTLFEYAPVGYHEIDSEGRIVRMNQTELAMLGYTHEEITGQYIWKLFENEAYSYKRTKEKLEGKLISSKPYERVIITKNKSTITVLLQDKIIKSKDGTILGTRSSVQDISERKQAEFNLQMSESKFRNIFENSVVGKSMTSLEGKMNVNKAFSQIVGYSEEELFQLNWGDITYPDDLEYNRNEVKLLLKGEKTFSHWEKRYIHKNGHIVWVDISIFLLQDIMGNPTHFITEIYDITDRKKAETDLRQSEEKFKKAFMTSPDSVNINRMEDGMYASINSGFTRIMGYSEEDVLGKTSKEISIWESQSDREKLVKELKKKRFVENQVSQFRNKSGDKVYGMMSASVIDLDGSAHILSITRDITELKNTEIALQQSEERFKVLFEDAPDTMFLADPETGKIVDANAAACRLFKKQKQELVGINQYKLHPVEDTDMSIETFKNHITQSQTLDTTIPVENTILCSDGTQIPVEILAHSITIDGKTFILGTFRDISERKKAEQALQKSEDLYRHLVLRIPDGVYKSTKEGKFIDVNPAMVKMLGYKNKEELMSIDIKTQLYVDSSERDKVVLNRQNEELSVFPLKKKDGSEIWIEDHGWYNTDKEGNIVTHEGVLRDITDRKLAQDALQERENMLKKTLFESSGLIDNSSEGIDYDKISNTILEISGAKYVGLNIVEENGLDFSTVSVSGIKENFLKASSLFGFEIMNRKWKFDPILAEKTKDNAITRFKSFKELSSFSIPKRISTLAEKIFQVGDAFIVKISKNNKMIGDFTLIYSKGETLRNNELVLLYANQVALYIDREKTDRALRANEEKYRYLFANNPQPMWIYDLDTLNFIEVNLTAINHYGYTREEFLSMKITDIRPPEDIPALITDVTTRGDDKIFAGEWRHTKKNGEIIIVDISSVSVVSNGRNARHVMVQDITERKQVENSIKESNSLLNATIESTADGILVVNSTGRITLFNKKFVDMWKIPKKMLDNKEDEPMLNSVLNQVKNQKEFLSKVNQLYSNPELSSNDQIELLDGRVFDRYSLPYKIENNIVGRVWSFRDITLSKIAEKALRISEDKFRSITEQIEDLIIINDTNGIINYASPASRELFQYEPQEMNGHHFMEFIHEDSKEYAIATFRDGVEKRKKAVDIELKLKRKDGSPFYGELNGTQFMNGELIGVLVVLRDITKRKHTVELLMESEEKFRSITEQTSDLISITDKRGVLIYASTASKSMFNYEPEEMCGHNFTNYLDEDSIEKAKATFRKNIESKESINNLELKMKRKDGSQFYGELNGSIFKYGDNYGTLIVIRDMTERKKAQEDIEQKMNELIRFHSLTVDREMTMIELKKEINELLNKSGQEEKYKIVD